MKVRTSYMVTFIIAVFICSVVLLTVIYSTWCLEIRLFWKDHFGKLENGNSDICLDVKHLALCLYTEFIS
jgi:hypothetical protein